MGPQPPYEGLKHASTAYHLVSHAGTMGQRAGERPQPPYEGLKPAHPDWCQCGCPGPQPPYEGLKRVIVEENVTLTRLSTASL